MSSTGVTLTLANSMQVSNIDSNHCNRKQPGLDQLAFSLSA